MKRRVTSFWFAMAAQGGWQMIRLECGHERPVAGAKTEEEAAKRADLARGKTVEWWEECGECGVAK